MITPQQIQSIFEAPTDAATEQFYTLICGMIRNASRIKYRSDKTSTKTFYEGEGEWLPEVPDMLRAAGFIVEIKSHFEPSVAGRYKGATFVKWTIKLKDK